MVRVVDERVVKNAILQRKSYIEENKRQAGSLSRSTQYPQLCTGISRSLRLMSNWEEANSQRARVY